MRPVAPDPASADPSRPPGDGGRPPPPVDARYRVDRPGFALDVEVEIPGRGVTGLFGPSGSGKTTLLRCLAGIERAAVGRLRVGGEVWEDSAAGLRLPPHRRRVGYVFQEPSLFPHLSVRRNIEYGHRRTPVPRRRVQVDAAVEWLGVGPLLDRRPGGLSGGERQRAAIARALVTSPRLLLMDEPLSALDRESRRTITPYLERLPHHLSIPIVYVSHSLREIGRLADHLVWLGDGRVRASGPASEIVARIGRAGGLPEDAASVVHAVVRRHDEPDHLSLLDGPWGPIWVGRLPHAAGATVRLQVLASDVSLGRWREEDTSILNQFPMTVARIEASGPADVLVELRGREIGAPGGDAGPPLLSRVMARSARRLGLREGAEVVARVKAVAVLE